MNNKPRKYRIADEKMFDYRTSFVPLVEEEDTRPMKGTKLTGDSQPHHNIFLAAKKRSGKTISLSIGSYVEGTLYPTSLILANVGQNGTLIDSLVSGDLPLIQTRCVFIAYVS